MSAPHHRDATYRLQLNADFTLDHAAAAVPYLARLGISHLYLSPIWMAVPGSQHGYDVIDHARVSEDLGGLPGLYRLGDVLRAHEMGLVVDIVPNHVGITDHPWWRDVLRFGPASSFAAFFDIDWSWPGQPARPVVVCPVLGKPFGATLDSGELSLDFDGNEIVVRYWERTFPVAPASYPRALGLPPADLDGGLSVELAGAIGALASAAPSEAAPVIARLAYLSRQDAAVEAWIRLRLAAWSGEPGVPASWDNLESLLAEQHYRLAYWRVSSEEINYRRFFDINELAAIRQEHRPAFEATHRLLGELVASGLVSGIRVDHVDGLYDPGGYLNDLRTLVSAAGGADIWVEKILATNESLPAYWPVQGTTGYDFLAVAGGVLVDRWSDRSLSAIYEDFVGAPMPYEDVAFAAKRQIAGRSFAGELNVLARELHRLAEPRRMARDNTRGALGEAIASLIAALPVYRTYLENEAPMERDESLIRAAADEALRRDANLSPEAMSFLVKVLLLDDVELQSEEGLRWVRFRRHFQQLSSPVAAKGVEDTAFFRHCRFLASNEVGDNPLHIGVAVREAHQWFAERTLRWPAAMSATSTHDTKRSEDVRMRLAALAQYPREWQREVRAWRRLNQRHKQETATGETPDANTEYFIYQTIVGSWQGAPDPEYVERIANHLTKALREAKQQTSWTRINAGFENAVTEFVRAILRPQHSGAFTRRVDALVERIEPAAHVNSLALLTLKCTAPGVPDFYQGAELPLHRLTDPDNRSPVDFSRAAAILDSLPKWCPDAGESLATKKLWLTRRLLQIRCSAPEAFAAGDYLPLEADGTHAGRVFAFLRAHDSARIAVIVPRVVGPLFENGAPADPGWDDTLVTLPGPGKWRDELTLVEHPAAVPLAVTQLLARFPVAVLAQTAE